MRMAMLVGCLLWAFGTSAWAATEPPESKEAATTYLVMLDASAAMALPFGGGTRLETTTRVLNEILSQSARPGQIELFTYGYSEQSQCKDFLMAGPIRADRMDLLDAQLKCVMPRATLPLDMVIEQQIGRLEAAKAIGRIIVISGGLEKHRASVCLDAEAKAKHHTQVDVLVVDDQEGGKISKGLECLAKRYGGKAERVKSETDLARAIVETIRVEGLSMVSMTAALSGGKPLVDADLAWRLVLLDVDGKPTLTERSFRSANPIETLEPGTYRLSVTAEGVEGKDEIVLVGGRHHTLEIALECRSGSHPNRADEPTGCLSDFDFGSCGHEREDCREYSKDNGIVGCDGTQCTLACDSGHHFDDPDKPRACLSDLSLASCGSTRVDCSTLTVDKADVGCDGIACTVTCLPGLYQELTESGTVCLDNHAYCVESAERTERSWISAASGAAASVGAGLLFWSQRGSALDLNDEVQAYNTEGVRPAATFLDLEDRGKSIARWDTVSLVTMALGAAAAGYAGYEWVMRPNPTVYSCAGPIVVRQGGDDEVEEPSPEPESSPDSEPIKTEASSWSGFDLTLGQWLKEVVR